MKKPLKMWIKKPKPRSLFWSISFWSEYFIRKLIYYYLMRFGLLIFVVFFLFNVDWLCDFPILDLLLNSLPFAFHAFFFTSRFIVATVKLCMQTKINENTTANENAVYILIPRRNRKINNRRNDNTKWPLCDARSGELHVCHADDTYHKTLTESWFWWISLHIEKQYRRHRSHNQIVW